MKKKYFLSFLFLFIYAVLLKLCSAVMGLGDAGEFIASGYVLGVSHPPGYSLYALLGRIFTLLPLGSIALRVNLASVMAGALSLSFVYLITFELGASQVFAALAALTGLCAPLFLEQALGAEVYVFNTAFVLGIFYLFIRRRRLPFLLLASFLLALAFSMHYLVLAVVPILAVLILQNRLFNNIRFISILFLTIILGLSSFMYQPLRAIKGPPVNWGSPHKLEHFVNHVRRQQYKNLEFGRVVTIRDKLLYLKEFAKQLFAQYHLLLFLVFFGFWHFSHKGKIPWEIILLFLMAGPGIIFLLQFKFEELNLTRMRAYYLPAFLCLPILMGLGLVQLKRLLEKTPFKTLLITVLATVCLIILFNFNKKPMNQRNNYLSDDFGRNMLLSLPRNAVFFTAGDNKTTPFCYTLLVEDRRPDLLVFDRSRNLFDDIFRVYRSLSGSLKPIANEDIEKYLVAYYQKKRPVIFSLRPEDQTLPDYQIYAYGFFTAILPQNAALPNPLAPFRYFNYRFMKDELVYRDYLSLDVISNYYYHLGKAYVELGQTARASLVFKRLTRFGNSLKHIHNNLGVLLKRYGYWLPAAEELEKALRLDPNYAEAAYNLAQLTERFEKKKAIRQWRYYLKIAAGNPQEARYIERAQRRLDRLLGEER